MDKLECGTLHRMTKVGVKGDGVSVVLIADRVGRPTTGKWHFAGTSCEVWWSITSFGPLVARRRSVVKVQTPS